MDRTLGLSISKIVRYVMGRPIQNEIQEYLYQNTRKKCVWLSDVNVSNIGRIFFPIFHDRDKFSNRE